MKRTISAMVGKGSVNHNSRKFRAENVDGERTHLNVDYCNEPIQNVYHELFDEALERYNAKQTRADRRIDNYYEKIRTGKQEKPFHELILQIGNRDDMASASEGGELAKKILDEYYRGFQERNPNLRVFSAHLHMDEATPHLHIDFVPFTTGSKRGLDTRVSLKQALAAQGFKGGTRGATEWNQWVQAEKEQLAQVMERYDLEWERKGTHEEHLSVLDYKKQERTKEVSQLDAKIEKQEQTLQNNDQKLKRQKTVALTMSEVENTGRKTLFGKVEMTQQEAAELKQLAEYGLSVNAEIASLNQKLDSAKQEARIWRERYEALVEQTKDFMAALKRAPERVKEFIQRVLRAEPEQLRKEPQREITRPQHQPQRRSRNRDMER